MAHVIFFFIISFFILFSYVAFLFPKIENKTDILLGSFTLSIFQLITTQYLLGTAGFLNTTNTYSFNLLITLIIFLFFKGKIGQIKFKKPVQYDIKSVKNIFVLQLIIVAYGLIIFLGLLIPPYAWDSITYHLLAVFSWAKAERITLMQPIGATSFFPMNGELIMLWIYLISKNMHLLNLAQVPFAFILAISTYSLARKFNIRSAKKVIPIVLLTPVVMLLCTVEYVDLIFACFVILSLNFIIGYINSKDPIFLFLSCIAFGLTAGTKPGGFIAILVSLILLGYAYRIKESIKYIPVSFIMVFASGGFWYIRNIILTGNPVFPYTIKFLKFDIFKGITELGCKSPYESWFVSNRWEWFLYPILEKVRGEFTYSIENGFGVQFVLGIISLLYALYLSILKKDKTLFFIFFIFPLSIFVWFKTNTCPVPRYIIFLCAITAIAIAYVLDHLNHWQKKIMNLLIIYCLSFSFITSLPRLIPHQANVLNAYLKNRKLSSCEYYKWVYGKLGNAWEWLNKNITPGSTIAYNYPELIIPLYGKNLQNDIIHIVTYNTPYKAAFAAKTYEEWKNLLIKHKASYFFLYIPFSDPKIIHADYKWIKSHPACFTKIQEWQDSFYGNIILYKIQNHLL